MVLFDPGLGVKLKCLQDKFNLQEVCLGKSSGTTLGAPPGQSLIQAHVFVGKPLWSMPGRKTVHSNRSHERIFQIL